MMEHSEQGSKDVDARARIKRAGALKNYTGEKKGGHRRREACAQIQTSARQRRRAVVAAVLAAHREGGGDAGQNTREKRNLGHDAPRVR